MRVLLALRLALRSLSRNKLRATLTILGILIGVAAVVTMTAMGAGAKDRMARQMASLGANMLVVYPGTTATSGAHSAQGTSSSLTEDDANAIAREVPTVAAVAPTLSSGAQVVAGDHNASTHVSGVTPAYFDVRSWTTVSGALFDDSDVRSAARVCLIGETVHQELFPNQDPIGQPIRVGTMPCTVVGLLAPKGQSAFGQDQDDTVIVPITAYRAHISRLPGTAINAIFISAQDPNVMHRATDSVTALLEQRHRVQPDNDDFSVRNLQEIANSLNAQQSALSMLLLAVASISLLVGGIGVMNIMLVSVSERTREIGIRQAIGAQAADIMAQFLTEAVVLAAIGGLAGLALGALGSAVLAHTTSWSVQIQPSSAVLAVAVSGLIGVVFGFVPARRAAHLDPIVALRHE